MRHSYLVGTESTSRIKRLREMLVSTRPRVCYERAKLVTDVYRHTEDIQTILRRAVTLEKILEGISVYILDGELIVGHLASTLRGAPVFPEMDVEWLEKELDTLETRAYDQFIITEQCKEELRALFPYWKGKTLRERLFTALPEDTKRARLQSGVFSVTAHEESGLGHVLLDYERVLRSGLNGIRDEAEQKIEALDLSNPEDLRQLPFFRAIKICCSAAIAWANRYSAEADRLARLESDPVRRRELEKIADVCAWVPGNPARDFHEALQSLWFVHLVPQLETDGVAITPGRLDQYMYPFYRQDIDSGCVNQQGAQELLDCLWLKFAQLVKLYNLESASVTSGFPMGQNVVIGGTDEYGRDATNELSYMCLEAHRHVQLLEPNFSVRLHKNTPQDFLMAVCENIRLGTGHPEVFNEDIAIPGLMARGIPMKEARNYAPIGCVENSVVGMWMRANGGYFCLTKALELALNDGVCRLTGRQVGPSTGKASDFKAFPQIMDAYREQIKYFVHHLVVENNMIDFVHGELMPIPFVSMLVDGCIPSGKDVTWGGAKYNLTCPGGVGVANTADSLASIKKLVFEDQRLTMSELQRALDADFTGYEAIRLMLLNEAPKYGNDEPYVDYLARQAVEIFLDELETHKNPRGGQFVAGMTAITANIAFGRSVGATPDGRKAKEALAEGISPAAGRDRCGPTAAMKSVTRLDHMRIIKGVIYNQKYNPNVFAGFEGLEKFTQLLRAYCSLGGFHVQFNVISGDTLKDAQRNPEKYRGLVVRVAGYSAFFNELSKEVQDIIIARTEYDAI